MIFFILVLLCLGVQCEYVPVSGCDSGEYFVGNNAAWECKECPNGQYQNRPTLFAISYQFTCKYCQIADGFFIDDEPFFVNGINTQNKEACLTCPEGWRTNSEKTVNDQSCIKCPNTQPYTDGNTCFKCAPGKYSEEETCLDCPSGYYWDDMVCHSCEGYQDEKGQSDCKICPIGRTFSNDRTKCVVCAIGKYSDEQNVGACKEFENNVIGPDQYNGRTGFKASMNQVVSDSYSTTPASCERGKYVRNFADTECVQCPLGLYQEDARPNIQMVGFHDMNSELNKCKLCAAGSTVTFINFPYHKVGVWPYRGSGPTCGYVSNRKPILDKAACEAAATAMGLDDVVATEYSSSGYPPGCFWRFGSLRYNTLSTSDTPCTQNCDFCLCVTASQDAFHTTCEQCPVVGYRRDSTKVWTRQLVTRYQFQSCIYTDCPKGTYGANCATSCPIHTYLDSYKYNDSYTPTCRNCPRGQFQDETGQTACKSTDKLA